MTTRCKDNYWKTKDGRYIAMKDMSDYHLLNAIAYLKRICQGDFGTVPDFDDMERDIWITRQEQLTMFGYYKLLAEKRKRNL